MLRLTLAALAGLVVIYGFGVIYLAGWLNVVKHATGLQLVPLAIVQGAGWFAIFDVPKAVIAAGVARRTPAGWFGGSAR